MDLSALSPLFCSPLIIALLLFSFWLLIFRPSPARFPSAIQDGVEAGQKIPCVHIHLIPRRPKDLIRKDDIYDLVRHARTAIASSRTHFAPPR